MDHHLEGSPNAPLTEADARAFAQTFGGICDEVGRVVLGNDALIRLTLVGLFARGHVLLEGPPGIGKTLLARALARTLGVRFTRIQFTPDLMPSDVTGGNIFNQGTNAFEFHPGPVFTEILLADEINRAPAKTQASLLEAMGDRQVTTDGETRPLAGTFFTLATQNPIESEGTYPLPEAQLDRFLLKLLIEHPPEDVEITLLNNYVRGFDAANLDAVGLATLVDASGIERMRGQARQVRVDPEILEYIARIVGRTRNHHAVDLGASPRASIALLLCSQVIALSEGRTFVVPDDVKELAAAVLRHRFVLQPDAELEGTSPDDVVANVLSDVPVPGGQTP